MQVKLLRDSRIWHKAGDIVEVSPAECQFLTSVGSAVEVAVNASPIETTEKPKATTRKRAK
jgi:hypothetical protein